LTTWIARSYALGVDALSYNLEVYTSEGLNRHCIGRARYIGRERYLEALAYAAGIFPRGTVWTELALGIEPIETLEQAISDLTGLGVVPVVSLAGSTVAHGSSELVRLFTHLHERAQKAALTTWLVDLATAVTPLEAAYFLAPRGQQVANGSGLHRSRLGALAVRNMARLRRRLRVRPAQAGGTH